MENKIESIYPLSPMQEGMLFHKLLNENSTEYVVRYTLILKGKLEISRIRESLDLLAEKYEVLRTAITMPKKGGRPWQVILRDRQIELNVIDISCEQSPEDQIEKIKQDDLNRGFDLEKDSLLRATVVRKSSDENIVLWSLHHIILDGWCSSVVLINFIQNYADISNGKSVLEIKEKIKVEKVSVAPYAEYIKWLEKQDKKTAMQHWDKLLQDYSGSAVILPLGINTGSKEQMGRLTLDTGSELSDKVKKIAKQKGITINTILESALGVLLQKYNNSNDVVFGKVVSGRNADIPGIDKIVGLFINTIPVRVKNDKGTTCEQLLADIHNQAINSSNYDFCSLADIQNQCCSSSELIKVLFVYENYYVDQNAINQGKLDLGDKLNMEIKDSREQTNYPLSFSVSLADTLKLDLLYDPKLFCEEEIKLILERYRLIIKEIIEHPGKCIEDICTVGEDEKRKIINDFNNTTMEYPKDKTVVNLLETQVSRAKNKAAVVFGEEKITYGELDKKSNQLALKLRKLGVTPNDFVAVMAERSIEMIIGICGIIKAGGAIVVLDSSYPKERIDYIIGDCRPKALLIYKVEYKTNIPLIDLSETLKWEGVSENVKAVNKPDDLIYLIYTSGTTGKPKGVMIEHRSVIRLVCNANYVDLNENTILLQTGSMSFDASTFEIWGTLLNGGELHLAESDVILDAKALKQTIKNESINTMFLTTALFNQLINLDEMVFEKLDTLLFGGEKASETHILKLVKKNKKIKLINLYGPTETTTLATWYPINNSEQIGKIPIGGPISNTKVFVMNEMELCGVGIPGELCVTGVGVAKGYLNHPELTAEKFVDNPFGEGKMYRSGDVARWLPDGNIEFLGRVDEQIKLRGFRIELGEIENVIRKLKGIRDVVVVLSEENAEKSICAYIVAEPGKEINNIREELRNEVPGYMIPSHFMLLDKLPVNRNGKVDRKVLPKIEVKSGHEYVEPESEAGKAIVKVFEEILGVEKVGIKDNFYDLGGDSIKAIRIISRLRGLEYNLTIRDIIYKPTIEHIIEKACGNEELQNIDSDEDVAAAAADDPVSKAKRELEVSSVAILEDLEVNTSSFKKTKLFEELTRYDNNMEAAGISDSFEPFGYQKLFLIQQPENIICTKTSIKGAISREKITDIVREIVKEQCIFRYSYDSSVDLLSEYNYIENWYVPYLDIDDVKDLNDALRPFESLRNVSALMSDNRFLVKILIVKLSSDEHVIYLYAQHCVFDYISVEIFGNLIKNKCYGEQYDKSGHAYSEYVKERQKKEDALKKDSKKLVDAFIAYAEKLELLTKGQKLNYLVEFKSKISQDKLESILENPIQWGVQLFSLINLHKPDRKGSKIFTMKYFIKNLIRYVTQLFSSESSTELLGEKKASFPFILIHFNNLNDRGITMGLYLDPMLQLFDVDTGMVATDSNITNSDAILVTNKLSTLKRNKYFGRVPSINFVTVFDKLYQIEDFGEYSAEIIKLPRTEVIRGHITMRVVNDMLHMMIPCFDNDLEGITNVIKDYLDKTTVKKS